MPPKSPLHAQPGDRLVVRAHHQGQAPRDAEVLEVLGEDGGPPFRVRWDDGSEAEIFPGSDVFIEHIDRAAKRKKS